MRQIIKIESNIKRKFKQIESGEVTPEGIHHDENDFVWIHLINKENSTGGRNNIYNN